MSQTEMRFWCRVDQLGNNAARIGERSYEKEHESHRGSIAQCRMRLQTLGVRIVRYGASESYGAVWCK